MAQGAIKKKPKPAPSSKRAQHTVPKKGKRSIAPRKSTLVKARGITKKYSAGLHAKTESALAQKAGHLELLQGGKKKKAAEKKGAGKKVGGAEKDAGRTGKR